MLNRRRLLFAGVATLPGVAVATSGQARKPKPKPKPKWQLKIVTRTFTSRQLITIPESGISARYPSKIQVSGLREGRIRKVTVTLSGLTHSWPNDLDIMLADNKGRGVILMNEVGVTQGVTGITLTFDAAAVTPPPDPLVSGTYLPTSNGILAPLPPPAPQGITGTALSVFNNLNPNGAWSLYVFDDGIGDTGTISGWSLKITARIKVRGKRRPKPKRKR